MSKQQPYAIGQEVAAVKDSVYGRFKKGQKFICVALKLCKCGEWLADVNIGGESYCPCGNQNNGEWIGATCFAPIDRLRRKHKFEITCTLPESVDERSDEPVKIKS